MRVLNDGGDTGPAELQNNETEADTYEAVVDYGETTNVSILNAHIASEEVRRAVTNIREEGNTTTV